MLWSEGPGGTGRGKRWPRAERCEGRPRLAAWGSCSFLAGQQGQRSPGWRQARPAAHGLSQRAGSLTFRSKSDVPSWGSHPWAWPIHALQGLGRRGPDGLSQLASHYLCQSGATGRGSLGHPACGVAPRAAPGWGMVKGHNRTPEEPSVRGPRAAPPCRPTSQPRDPGRLQLQSWDQGPTPGLVEPAGHGCQPRRGQPDGSPHRSFRSPPPGTPGFYRGPTQLPGRQACWPKQRWEA